MPGNSDSKFKFGPFELSGRDRVLRREGVQVPLGNRALDILVYLAERPGEVIPKKELIDHVWSGVAVEEVSLRVHVAAIRKALRDGQFGNRYIANIQGRGYCFVGTVVRREDGKDRRRSRNFRGRPPARSPMLVNCEAMVSAVLAWIQQGQFVAVLGPGGIGKTMVAVVAGHPIADAFDREVHVVNLGGLTDPDRSRSNPQSPSNAMASQQENPQISKWRMPDGGDQGPSETIWECWSG